MAKVRIYDIAKELAVSPKEILDMLNSIGVANKVASSSVEDTAARSLRQLVANRNAPEPVVETPVEVKPVAPAKFGNFQRNDFRGRPADENENGEVADGAEAPVSDAPPAQSAPGAGAIVNPVVNPIVNPIVNPVAPGAGASAAPAANGGASNGSAAPARPQSSGYQGNRPQGGGGNRGGSGPNRGNSSNNRPQSPAPATGTAGAAPTPALGINGQPIVNPPVPGANGIVNPIVNPTPAAGGFAMGSRDRRAMKSGKYRGGRGDSGPRFGDKDFRVETESANTGDGDKIVLSGPVTVSDLADMVKKPVNELVKALFAMSIMRSANQLLEVDVASVLAARYGFAVEKELNRSEALVMETEDHGTLVSVPPVVTIMGHVDHGKTSLLDKIRNARVQAKEAGGITQRIGAYETIHNGERIVFLDTPGHEAFTRMRARGAHVTDIAVLVVAADDGVMPQTREAIDHARAAKVPIIVALNKMDRAEADPDRILGQLAEVGLIPESYGGDITVVPVSAKTGDGVQELLDIILLVAELQELKANPDGPATGTIIEARQDTQRGPVATVLLQSGTLKTGSHIVVGEVYGRVRAMLDYNGKPLMEAGPKTPVFLTGLSGVPHTSDTMRVVDGAREAREQADAFRDESNEGKQIGQGRSLNDLMARIQEGNIKELNLIVKADGQGSVEALCSSLEKLAHEEVRARIIARGVGGVTESDVMLASASEAIIIAFSVNVDGAAQSLADREKVEISQHSVIYAAIDEVKSGLEGMLTPMFNEVYMGQAEIKNTFKSTKAGSIAGCYVSDGKLIAGAIMKIQRNKRQIFEGKIDSLRHFKSEIKEMTAGQECGVSSTRFNDFQVGDIIQCFTKERIKRTID
ncbi:translation initiation factor IF-2 [Abditibacterium utsteinense]|uniref:Translation initiation factor IF-2 n=1 Tax=Abditibacterium utsteinense TaxID=1960156 RepID=A0A2S8SVU8_9BACT|nr:translation initiation factor IF-2 [Abditibacterium utsteinense]PQV64919.1 translation initiation factor IF-2 [Abditibacterium utsteinense]